MNNTDNSKYYHTTSNTNNTNNTRNTNNSHDTTNTHTTDADDYNHDRNMYSYDIN